MNIWNFIDCVILWYDTIENNLEKAGAMAIGEFRRNPGWLKQHNKQIANKDHRLTLPDIISYVALSISNMREKDNATHI